MKFVVAVGILAAISMMAMAEEDVYTSRFDNVNVDEILKSDRLFNNYFKCLIDEGKCTPDARELKKVLPDALQTACSKCTDKQKEIGDKVIRYIIDHKPNEWKILQKKYDPDNIYYNKYKPEAEARGIKL